MKFTKMDKKIINSYIDMIDALSEYLGEGFEIVLHSLEDRENSIVKIKNGHLTGRKLGDPLTDLALEMLNHIESGGNSSYKCYFTNSKKDGKIFKSTTVPIKGTGDKIIALLCINFNLNTSVIDFFKNFADFDSENESENFISNNSNNIEAHIMDAILSVEKDQTILPSLRKRETIRILYRNGIFNIKNSINIVSEKLEISKSTVYMHLNIIKSEES